MSTDERPRVVLVNRCFIVREDKTILIVQRALNDNNNPGKWEVPGGKVDLGQDILHALEREVLEETGLLVKQPSRFEFSDGYLISDGKYQNHLYVALFSITCPLGGNFELSDEHCNHAWVTYTQLLDYDLTVESKKAAIVLREHLQY